MRVSCPACGAAASLDVLIGADAARAAVLTALALPAPLAKSLVQYVALFRPKARQLSFDRLASLLGELLPLIEAARIERHGRVFAAPIPVWQAALDELLAGRERLTLPLKSHGYLLEIIAALAGKAECQTERKTEAARAGRTPAAQAAAHRPAHLPEPAVKNIAAAVEGLARAKSAMKGQP